MKRITVTILFLWVFSIGFSGWAMGAANAHVDPEMLQVVSAESELTIDGKLDETDWQRRFDYLVFDPAFSTGDVQYAVTDCVTVQGPYLDTTRTNVKFLHRGTDLYIALESDDHSVCRFDGSWEGDGLFMKINDASGATVEYKLYFNLAGDDPDIHLETPGNYPNSAEAGAWKPSGTIVNDTTAADSGYTAEMVIHLDALGYTEPLVDVPVLVNIFDPDGYAGVEGESWENGSYFKMWWGSEWGPDMRTLRLADPPNRMAYSTETEIALDGELNEDFWGGAESVTIGKNSATSTGGFYMQYGDTLNEYTDQSMAEVKFIHHGTDLYVGVQSDDKSVCKWSPGWEADGLFLWMTNKGQIPAAGERIELKAMYFSGNEGDGIEFQTSGTVPTGGAEAASFEPEGTVTHSAANGEDAGYSIEMVIHTELFGYTEGDTVNLSAVIWDLDHAEADNFDQHVSDYAPHWWGTQWADPNFEKYYMYRGVIMTDQSVGTADEPEIARTFRLHQNYPNPFNPSTRISFEVPVREQVSLTIHNILGQRVATLVESELDPGNYEFIWDGTLQEGQTAPAGVYFYRLTQGEKSATAKMVLMK